MARCFPDYISDKKSTHIENLFFRRIKDELSNDYVVLPSLERAAAGGFHESEADFVILHPRGRLLVEIKGGGWRRIKGRWERAEGSKWVQARCPLQQSRSNCHSLRKSVESAFPKGSAESACLFGRAVVFPEMDAEFNTGEFPREIFLSQRDLLKENGLEKAFERLFDFAEVQYRLGKQAKDHGLAQKKENYDAKVQQREPVKIEPNPLDSYPLPERLTPEQVLAVAEVLRPDIKPTFSLSADQVNRALIRFSASQLRVLDAVERNKRLRIIGGPGSGKTLLAFESVRRELRERPGAKVGIVCFNRSLGGFLADVAKSEGLPPTVTVGSFYVHVDHLLRDEGKTTSDASYFDKRVQAALAMASSLSEDQKFDLLVVDEGQDFRDDADKIALMDAMLKGGLSKGRWRWFEDLNQILTPPSTEPTDPRLTAFTELLDETAEIVVSGNWRNTEQIVQRACNAIGVPYEEDELGLHGPPVESGVFPEGRENELIAAVLEKRVAKEIADGQYQAEDVVLLSMRGGNKASFEGLTSLGGFTLEPYDVTQPTKPGVIRISSVFKFKGMESHAVILVDVDDLKELRDRRKAYVGITRARYRLFVIGTKEGLATIFS